MPGEENKIPEHCRSCLQRSLDGCTIDVVQLSKCLRITNDKEAIVVLKFNKKHDPG